MRIWKTHKLKDTQKEGETYIHTYIHTEAQGYVQTCSASKKINGKNKNKVSRIV